MTKDLKTELRQVVLRLAKTVFNYSVSPTKVAALEDATEKFLKLVGQAAEERAVEIAKKVQEATKVGFEKFSEDVTAIKDRLSKIEEAPKDLAMIIAIAGERFGHIFSMYEALRKDTDWLIQIGSLGAFPDKVSRTKALRKAGTPDDFQAIHSGAYQVPCRTIFTMGKHDDCKWLEYRTQLAEFELAYNLSFIGQGNKTIIGTDTETISVIGIGKTFSPVTWTRGKQKPSDLNHYTRRDVERACSNGPASIMACHEPLYGTKFNGRDSVAQGLQKAIFATRPQLVVHRSYDKTIKEYSFLSSKCYAIPAYEIIYFSYTNEQFTQL